MKTLGWIIVGLFAVVAWPMGVWGQEAATSDRPNIVFFLADDLGWADVPWHGSPAAMPNLQRLAEEGLKLEAHYVHPMCSPTRTALMTGRFASRYGVTKAQNVRALPFDTLTLAKVLQTAGYDTALIGKWHLGSKPQWGPQHFGFDYSYGSLAGGVGPYDHSYKRSDFTETWHRNGQFVQESGHVTDLIAGEAVKWLEGRSGKPFFLYVPFSAIHVPIDEPEEWLAKNAQLNDPGQRLRAACATHMDHAIGQILAALQRTGVQQRTLIVFASDNGAHGLTDNQGGAYLGKYPQLKVGNDNLPLRGHKTEVYEGGIRTPALVHWPKHIQPGSCQVPLHIADWLPTLSHVVSQPIPVQPKLDGTNVWSVLSRQSSLAERTLYSAAPNYGARMVRRGNWKLIVTQGAKQDSGKNRIELFDLSTDIGESKNLADQKPEVVAQLQHELSRMVAEDNQFLVQD